MKKLSICLFLIFFSFSAPSFADDISEFQIEGMSIGDSLSDFFSEEEIKNSTDESWEDRKLITITLDKIKDGIYEAFQITYEEDKNKTIHAISGVIDFENNIKGCYKKMDEIISELSVLFKDEKTKDWGVLKSSADPFGGTYKPFTFEFNNGARAMVACHDWSEKIEITDNLKISVYSAKANNYFKSKN